MKESNRKKVSIYLPLEISEEIAAEAERLERSPGWLMQRAWRIARGNIRQLASNDKKDDDC